MLCSFSRLFLLLPLWLFLCSFSRFRPNGPDASRAQVLGAQLTELKRVRAVAQYMYKELQVVPWTLTANYIKRHGISASPVSKARPIFAIDERDLPHHLRGVREGWSLSIPQLPAACCLPTCRARLPTVCRITSSRGPEAGY